LNALSQLSVHEILIILALSLRFLGDSVLFLDLRVKICDVEFYRVFCKNSDLAIFAIKLFCQKLTDVVWTLNLYGIIWVP